MNDEAAQDPLFESKSPSNDADRTAGHSWFFAAFVLLLACVALFSSSDFWKDWFSFRDQILCSIGILLGLVCAIGRSSWQGERNNLRKKVAWSLVGFAALLIGIGAARSNSQWPVIAFAALMAGWCVERCRGETILRSISLGVAILIPFAIDAVAKLGGFEWLESATLTMTSLLADAAFQPNAQSDKTILFSRGIADQFSSIGTWDGVLAFLGVAIFGVLAFRRGFLHACVSIAISAFVWSTVRSVGWVAISCLANANETWYSWTFEIQLVLFILGVALLLSLDQFFGAIFTPIPFEYFDPESPFGSFIWNWLCNLPNVVLRIPEQNKIALRWRTRVKLAGKTPSIATDFDWIKFEFLAILFNPLHAIGSAIDAIRGWKENPSWNRFLINAPSFALLAILFFTMAFVSAKRTDNVNQFLSDESQKLCTTEDMESACDQQHEPGFVKIVGVKKESNTESNISITDSKSRQMEIQCKRILFAEPNNQVAKYRLGMIYALSGNPESAFREMTELANSSPAGFPRASAWLSKALIALKAAGKDIEMQELIGRLDEARKWKNVDFRLSAYYSRLLEEKGDGVKAVFILKEAVASNPQFILELARLYSRLGNDDKSKRTAREAEEYYIARSFEVENESNLLAIAEARMMADGPEEAAEILEKGLRNKVGGEQTRRLLSEAQLSIYWKSIRTEDNVNFTVDLDLLQKAAATDPTNPNISSEVSRLVSFGVKPTAVLRQVLRDQLDLGITNVASLLMISDRLYAKKDFQGAQKYLEIAAVKEPENPIVLNNLATCLVDVSTTNANRSLELASKANALSPDNATYLDTWGEILMIANRPKEAINKFERAIRIDFGRLNTRRKLVAAYKANGMEAMAKAQSDEIQDIEKAKAKEQNKIPDDSNEKTP